MQIATDKKRLIKQLNDLIQLDYGAISAYGAAIDHLRDLTVIEKLQEYKMDHERHVEQLQAKVKELGGRPKHHRDFKHVIIKGKVLFAHLQGDEAILRAMKAHEDLTNEAYEEAIDALQGQEKVDSLIQRNLQDARIHRAWLEHALHPA